MKNTKLVLFALFVLVLAGNGATAQFDRKQDYVALYRLYNSQAQDHLYTTNCDEKDTLIRNGAYAYEGVAGYLAMRQQRRTEPLYRLILENGRHFYTADSSEMNNLTRRAGNKSEGIVGYMASEQIRNTAPLYRLVNNDAKHFYTTNEQEKDAFLQSGGRLEGTTGYLWTTGSNRCDYNNSPGANSAPTVYAGTGFDGASQIIERDWNVTGDWDGSPNMIGAIRVPRGWYVVIYRRENFRGKSFVMSNDAVFTRDNVWYNRIRSIKVYKGELPPELRQK
jgi:hypothetical protein